MSYNAAYTSSFQSLEGVAWRVDICLPDHVGDPTVISLDADSPVVIEWPETKVYESVCPSQCTLKVVSETDRQMIDMMVSKLILCRVYRNNSLYWAGLIDECIYEEPYSYRQNYVTEITFSDLGPLNRAQFTMTGRHSFQEILSDILASAELTQTMVRRIKIQRDSTHALDFDDIMIDTDVFSAGDGCSKRDALERLLKSFGLRLVQLNGKLYMHDLEFMRVNATRELPFEHRVVWMGTDARIRGSENYGGFEVSANKDNVSVLADLFENLQISDDLILENGTYHAMMEVEENNHQTAYQVYPIPFFNNRRSSVLSGGVADTVPVYFDCKDRFAFWRVRVLDTSTPNPFPLPLQDSPYDSNKDLGSDTTPNSASAADAIIRIETDEIPLVPNRSDYLLRINLDLLFSPKKVPQLEPSDYNTPDGSNRHQKYKYFKANLRRVWVPVKLELIDGNGTVVKHCHNRQWVDGPAGFGDMSLTYCNDDEDAEGTPLESWATNMPSTSHDRICYKNRSKGEYVPLPDIPCRIRLTVSNAIFAINGDPMAYLNYFDGLIRWQCYKEVKVSLVNAGMQDNEDSEEELSVLDWPGPGGDEYTEQHDLFLWSKGVPPSAKGLVTDANLEAVETFYLNGSSGTLLQLRLASLVRQLYPVRPVLSGTARLTPEFVVFTDANTEGRFMRVGSVQDLQADTEQVTMINITPDDPVITAPKYSFSWSSPVCALRDISYRYDWSEPVCAKTTAPDHYTFAWSGLVCVYNTIDIGLEWEDF